MNFKDDDPKSGKAQTDKDMRAYLTNLKTCNTKLGDMPSTKWKREMGRHLRKLWVAHRDIKDTGARRQKVATEARSLLGEMDITVGKAYGQHIDVACISIERMQEQDVDKAIESTEARKEAEKRKLETKWKKKDEEKKRKDEEDEEKERNITIAYEAIQRIEQKREQDAEAKEKEEDDRMWAAHKWKGSE